MSGMLLGKLEDVWKRYEASSQLFTELVPLSTKALLGTQTELFDMVEFSSAVLTTCILTIEEKEKKDLMIFTERLLSAIHLASSKYFNNGDFNQNSYLDCVAAILSVWLDLTDSERLWPKIVLYNHGSNQHILDTLLQCSNIRTNMIERALQQVQSITTIQLFLRYVLCLRHVSQPKFKLFAISNQPDVNQYRLWLVKNNISSNISMTDIITSPKHDQRILSAICSASSYALPTKSEQLSMSMNDVPNVDNNVDNTSDNNLFFIDRGDVEECDDVEAEIENMDILNVTIDPIVTVNDDSEPISEIKQPIKIKNLKSPKKINVCKNVMIIAGSSSSKTCSSEATSEVTSEATIKGCSEATIEVTSKGANEAASDVAPIESVIHISGKIAALSETHLTKPCKHPKQLPREPEEAEETVIETPYVESKEEQTETLINPSLSLNPHNISILNNTLPISTESMDLIEDNAFVASSIRRSTRRRTTSVESETSVGSVASRTRNRKKVILEDAIELEAIAEDRRDDPKTVNKSVVNSLTKSNRSRKAKSSLTKVIEDAFVNKNSKTPLTVKAPKTSTKKKVRKLSHSSVEETPQMPVTRTRSRKLAI